MECGRSFDFVLNELFELNHFLGNDSKNQNEIVSCLIDLFRKFSSPSQNDGTRSLAHIGNIDAKNLDLIGSILRNSSNEFFVKWFPDYGCVLLAVAKVDMNHSMSLELIGLDRWECHMRSVVDLGWEQFALSYGSKVLHAGTTHDLIKFMADFEKCFAEAFQKDSNHPKSPSFIASILKNVLQSIQTNIRGGYSSQDPGGFADLKHRGKGRKVCWSLIKAVIEALLTKYFPVYSSQPEDEVLFIKFETNFYLWLLEQKVIALNTYSTIAIRDIDTIMVMLGAVGKACVSLAEKRSETHDFENRCYKARQTLDTAVLRKAKEDAIKYFYVPKVSLAFRREDCDSEISWRDPNVSLPATLQLRNVSSNLTKSRAGADINLGSHASVFFNNDTPGSIRLWMSKVLLKGKSNCESQQLVIRRVELWLIETLKTIDSIFLMSAGQDSYISELELLLNEYRLIQNKFALSKSASAHMKVELRSREFLSVWIAFCITHAASKKLHPILEEYDVAIRWEELRYLVLDSSLATAAVLSIAAYLKKYSGRNKVVFSLLNQTETFNMARKFSEGDPAIQRIWMQEQAEATRKESVHWIEVQRKQALAVSLRLQIIPLHAEIALFNAERAPIQLERDGRKVFIPFGRHGHYNYPSDDHDAMLVSKIRVIDNNITVSKENLAVARKSLTAAETPPPLILQPLPRGSTEAMKVLFFLHMPSAFKSLSKLSVVAQQMLIPRSFHFFQDNIGHSILENIKQVVLVPGEMISWPAYYTRLSKYQTGAEPQKVLLRSLGKPPTVSGLTHIDHHRKSSDGIWHPDILSPLMAWTGGDCQLDVYAYGKYFDPFCDYLFSPSIIKAREFDFTEALPIGSHSLSCFLVQHGYLDTDYSRGNEGISKLNLKPTWLNKPQFLTYAALRAYPNGQLRKICIALHDHALPLGRPEVFTLFRQALFQIGEIGFDDCPDSQLLWRRDGIEGYRQLEVELNALVVELKDSPKDHAVMHILGELASFVSQWSPSCRQVARDVSEITFDWAKKIDTETILLEEYIQENVLHQRAKQSILYMSSLLCHRYGKLTSKDAERICQLTFLAQNVRLFEDHTSYDAEIEALGVIVQDMMVTIAPQLDALISPQCSIILNSAVSTVLSINAADLKWISISDSLGCYEAVSNGHLYSANIISGVLLYDGLPPKRLPKSVLDHGLYKRSFGKMDFEIITCGDGFFRTAQPVAGYFYEFQLSQDDVSQLVIREIDESSSTTLELLDVICIADLPIRLQNGFSHWYSRDLQVILLRAISFSIHDIFFIINTPDGSQSTISWPCPCLSIPSHLQKHNLLQLLGEVPSDSDRLISHDSPLVYTILKKFETPDFIHTFVTNKGCFRFSLPRFKLEFETRDDSKGLIYSVDFSGYHLAKIQQLDDTLLSFDGYLILENESGRRKVLIPTGSVQTKVNKGKRQVSTKDDSMCDAVRFYYAYDIHCRLGFLKGTSIAAQLHLAALYTATASLLPEVRTKMTGDETAMVIVRGAWINRPLREDEAFHLEDIKRYSYRVPALSLLCYDLSISTRHLSFLHPGKSIDSFIPAFPSEAAEEYEESHSGPISNYHTALTLDETIRILNKIIPKKTTHHTPKYGDIEVGSYNDEYLKPLCGDIIKNTEDRLQKGIFVQGSSYLIAPQTFPLDRVLLKDTKIGIKMVADLEKSWNAYHELPVHFLPSQTREKLPKKCNDILLDVSQKIIMMENYLISTISSIPNNFRWDPKGFRFLKQSNVVPTVNRLDLMHIASSPEILLAFNPFLSESSCSRIRADILVWLQLCVLQDRISRIIQLCSISTGDEQLIQELQVHRNWDVNDYPKWLVFEVEASLQIRPTQYITAKALIESEGAIVQLNMGEGKTRVILPMLMLHLTSVHSNSVFRLHLLPQLLGEGFDHLHQNLSCSVLDLKLFLLPFNRDVELTPEMVRSMQYHAILCQKYGGCLIVAPEHCQSLHLKWHELRLKGGEDADATCVALDEFKKLKYIDMFDESDEILRHKRQLVYAVGDRLPLPEGPSRWNVVEAILRAIKLDNTVLQILERPNIMVIDTTTHDNAPEAFPNIRLVPGVTLDEILPELLDAIARNIIEDPIHELRWMRDVNIDTRKDIIRFITLPGELDENFVSHRMDDLLALRGFLACGILAHCLEKRHRVDYGVKRINGTKRMAVPFRANDTPSERAVFAHPDIEIIYTTLAYYGDGLSEEEFAEALTTLFESAIPEQIKVYSEWFYLSEYGMSSEDKKRIDSVRKIDPSNLTLFDILYKHYSHNIATVSFWLKYKVFPVETEQFQNKLVATAWNLANNTEISCRGFSGTSDNRLLLPLRVHQHEVEESSGAKTLLGTDGKMLDLLLKNPRYCSLESIDEGSSFQSVIKQAHNDGCRGIIDAGALMVGISNLVAANYILETLLLNPLQQRKDSSIQGVLFFDTSLGVNEWMIRDVEGREWPRYSSPVDERNCLVFFDESRCRGSDVKMRQDAVFMLTLGPQMCKDKLMQAAGRARLLGKGQRLFLVGMSDVTVKIRKACGYEDQDTKPVSSLQPLQWVRKKIRKACGYEDQETRPITSLQALQWVMKNTIASTEEGMKEWGLQGGLFCITEGKGEEELALLNEKISLKDLYNYPFESEVMNDVHKNNFKMLMAHRKDKKLSEEMLELMKEINSRVECYGSDFEIAKTFIDGECERELEMEREKELEVEKEYLSVSPRSEVDWDYRIILDSNKISEGLDTIGMKCLTDVIGDYFGTTSELRNIPWNLMGNIYCTKNFIETIVRDDWTQNIQEYLRPVDVLLYFPKHGGIVLLVSEREADKILSLMWTKEGEMASKFTGVRFVHLSYVKQHIQPNVLHSHTTSCVSFDQQSLNSMEIALIQLFNGDTTYQETQINALRKILQDITAKKAALLIPNMRGLHFMLPRSDLEIVCTY